MLLPAELIDHTFSFLRGDILALKACLKAHPILSRIAERYRYADIVVTIDDGLDSGLYERLSKHPHILNYPCTLEFQASPTIVRRVTVARHLLRIVSMIPRMANLVSLKLCNIVHGTGECFSPTFLPTLFDCLQHSSVERIHLSRLYHFPMSLLDNVKNLKELTWSNSRAITWPLSKQPHQLLETLIIRGVFHIDLFTQITGRIPNLKSLQLQDMRGEHDWNGFSGLLADCSNSLTELHLDVGYHSLSTYIPDSIGGGYWIQGDLNFPFTLSRLKYLKHLSIFARVLSTIGLQEKITCAFPAIIRLMKTAPALQSIILRLHWINSEPSSLGRLDWSLLQFDSPGIRPRIHLFISGNVGGHSISPENILEILSENEALMDLVKRELVILKSECIVG